MAVAAEVLLLVALITSFCVEGRTQSFILAKPADFCSISRCAGEGKELLWNSSAPHDSSLGREVSYKVSSLKVSDSGQHQEQERNSTLLICDDQKMRIQRSHPDVGQIVELTCDDAGPNQSVQWASPLRNHRTGNWDLALIYDETSSVYKLQQESLLVTVDRPLGSIHYYCLERSHHGCDVLRQFTVHVPPEIILRSVGESLEPNCSGVSGNQAHVWTMLNSVLDHEVESPNYTLKLPSLTSSHTGDHNCEYSDLSREFYDLLVCPASDPPVVALFTVGEDMTLQCGDWKETAGVHWFMRSNRTEGRVSRAHESQQRGNVYLSDLSLVIANISLEDTGEFCCVIMKDGRCVFRSQSLVMLRGSSEVCAGLPVMVMCVVVVTVVWSTRSREKLPVSVEEVSPASADRQIETRERDPVHR